MSDIFDEEEEHIALEEEGIINGFAEEAIEGDNDEILQEADGEEEDEVPLDFEESETEEEGFDIDVGSKRPSEVLRPSFDFARIARTYKKVSDAKEKFIPKDRREYQAKLQQIDEHNRQINIYKERLCRICRKDPITKCDEIEISRLKCCIKEALCNLNQLVKDLSALRVPKYCEAWKEIKLATSFDEEITPIQLTYNFLKAACKSRAVAERPPRFTPFSEKVKSAFSTGKLHRKKYSEDKKQRDLLKCILQQIRPKRSGWDYGDSESKHVVQYSVSIQSQLHKNGEFTRKISKKITSEKAFNAESKNQVTSNRNVKRSKNSQLRNQREISDNDLPTTASGRIICNDCWCDEISTLEQKVNNVEHALKSMKVELCNMMAGVGQAKTPKVGVSRQNEELKRLKKYYVQLYSEFKEKNDKLLEIKKRWGSCLKIFEQNNFSDDAMVRVFRTQYKNLCDEISKLKSTLKRQSEKIEKYRTKLMNAKQQAAEQKFLLDKIQTINNKTEDQINLELKQIKAKYQKQMQEFSNLPQLMQNEQRKICEAKVLRNHLENDLRFMCREFRSLKSQIMPIDNGPFIDWKSKYEEQRKILNRIRLEYDAMLQDKFDLCKKLTALTTQLNCLLFETGKMIKNCQEESENDSSSYRECSTRLEHQIVECRTDASSCEAAQKEKICSIQLQICNLQSSFEGAQRQIKCLKDRLNYLANSDDIPNFSIAMCSPTKC